MVGTSNLGSWKGLWLHLNLADHFQAMKVREAKVCCCSSRSVTACFIWKQPKRPEQCWQTTLPKESWTTWSPCWSAEKLLGHSRKMRRRFRWLSWWIGLRLVMRCWKVAERLKTRLKDVQFQYLGSTMGWSLKKCTAFIMTNHDLGNTAHCAIQFWYWTLHFWVHIQIIQPAAIRSTELGAITSQFSSSASFCAATYHKSWLPSSFAWVSCESGMCFFLQFGIVWPWLRTISHHELKLWRMLWQAGTPAVPLCQVGGCRKLLLEQAANQ